MKRILVVLALLATVGCEDDPARPHPLNDAVLHHNQMSIDACKQQAGVPIFEITILPTGFTQYMRLTRCELPPVSSLPERR